MTGCAICKNPFDRGRYDRPVRLGYTCDLHGEVGNDILLRLVSGDGANYRIDVCTQCRYDLMGATRRWVSGEFVEIASRRLENAGDCPCCGFETSQDARSLKVFGIPGIDVLHERFRLRDSVAYLVTCQNCRSEFTKYVLCAWLAGEFIADRRSIRKSTRRMVKLWKDPETGTRYYPPRIGWPRRTRGKVAS